MFSYSRWNYGHLRNLHDLAEHKIHRASSLRYRRVVVLGYLFDKIKKIMVTFGLIVWIIYLFCSNVWMVMELISKHSIGWIGFVLLLLPWVVSVGVSMWWFTCVFQPDRF